MYSEYTPGHDIPDDSGRRPFTADPSEGHEKNTVTATAEGSDTAGSHAEDRRTFNSSAPSGSHAEDCPTLTGSDPDEGLEMLPVADTGFSLPLAEGYYPDPRNRFHYCQDLDPDLAAAVQGTLNPDADIAIVQGTFTPDSTATIVQDAPHPDCSLIYLNTPGMQFKPQVHAIPIERRPRVARRAAEQTAVRTLLEMMVPGASLCNAPSGRPYLVNEAGQELPVTVSVTHSRHYAAVAVNNGAVGIDLEEPRSQLLSVATRFLSKDERFLYCKDIQLLLSAWTAKEAVYKAYHAYCAINGTEPLPVDFATDLELVATQGAILPTGRASYPASGARLHGCSFRLTHSRPFGSSMLTVAILVNDEGLHRNLVVDIR